MAAAIGMYVFTSHRANPTTISIRITLIRVIGLRSVLVGYMFWRRLRLVAVDICGSFIKSFCPYRLVHRHLLS